MSEGNRQDYPEHLNPFKPSRGSISKSFRKVFRSFTGKDKQRPQQRLEFQHHRHTVQPISTRPQHHVVYSPTALPRSRFRERLEKTENLKRTSKDRHWYTDEYNAINPFDETETNNVSIDKPPVPALRTKNRRRKKGTAPLPPPLMSSNGLYLHVPSRNGSKWSLTSTDTDGSSLCYSEYEEIEVSEKNREILEITKKIAEFTDDTNNNLTIIVASDITIKVDDIDSTGLNGMKKQALPPQEKIVQLQDNDIQPQENNIEPEEHIQDNNIQEHEEDIKPQKEENTQPEKEETIQQEQENIQQEEENIQQKENIQPKEENIQPKEENIQPEKEENIPEENKQKQEDEPCLPHEDQINEENIKLKEEDNTTKEENVKDENLKVEDDKIEKEIPKVSNTNGCVKNNEAGCDYDKKNDHNKNSLLRVRIIDNQEVVLRHPVDFPEDDLSTENYSIKQKIEHFESYRNSSPSKIRQTVLTKEKLLGTE